MRQYFGGYERISHFFYVADDSNPEVLLSLHLQNGEASVPSRCFWLLFCSAQLALGKLKVLLRVSRG